MVTLDTMGTQKKIAHQILEGGGDYVLSLKVGLIRFYGQWLK
jgi:predicted transposase YbfD/YdcC